jgi:hypothetical protein
LRVVHAFIWPLFNVPLDPPALGPPEGGLRNEANRIVERVVDHARAQAPEVEVTGVVVDGVARSWDATTAPENPGLPAGAAGLVYRIEGLLPGSHRLSGGEELTVQKPDGLAEEFDSSRQFRWHRFLVSNSGVDSVDQAPAVTERPFHVLDAVAVAMWVERLNVQNR